jgi:hypothetical protein
MLYINCIEEEGRNANEISAKNTRDTKIKEYI